MSHKFWQKSTSFIASGLLPFLFALFFFKEKGAKGVSQKLQVPGGRLSRRSTLELGKTSQKIGCHESYPKGVSKITTNLVDYQYFGRGLLAS